VDRINKRRNDAVLLLVFGHQADGVRIGDPRVGDLPAVMYFQL